MGLLSDVAKQQLQANGALSAKQQRVGEAEPDFKPVVRLFMPTGSAAWLLTELAPDDPSIAFGLCDLGLGFPELGSVSLAEIEACMTDQMFVVQQDPDFVALYPLSVYAHAARCVSRITVTASDLEASATTLKVL